MKWLTFTSSACRAQRHTELCPPRGRARGTEPQPTLERRAALAEKATSSAALRALEGSPRPPTYIPDPEFWCSGAGRIANFNKTQILGESGDKQYFPF